MAIGPARLGTARRMSGRHGTPCLPCRAAAGLVPCHQPKHGPVGLNPCRAGLLGTAKSPCRASPRPVGFKTHQKIHLNKKYSNLKYFFPRRASNQNQNHTHREQEEIKRITELCGRLALGPGQANRQKAILVGHGRLSSPVPRRAPKVQRRRHSVSNDGGRRRRNKQGQPTHIINEI